MLNIKPFNISTTSFQLFGLGLNGNLPLKLWFYDLSLPLPLLKFHITKQLANLPPPPLSPHMLIMIFWLKQLYLNLPKVRDSINSVLYTSNNKQHAIV